MSILIAKETPRGTNQRRLFEKRKAQGNVMTLEKVEKIIKNQSYLDMTRVFSISLKTYSDTSEFEKKSVKSFYGLVDVNGNSQYVWVGFTNDDFIVVVGKTKINFQKKSFGDLFFKYKEWGPSVTPRLIFEVIASEDQKEKMNEIIKNVNGYIKKAIIIPFSNDFGISISELEKNIGNLLLIENDIPILNKYSHNYR